MQTEFTNAERIRQDRLQAHAVEAAEQCGGTYVPEVAGLQKLSAVLADWPEDRHLIFADEALVGAKAALERAPDGSKWAILIGPEGGLGPRILRADTAAVAALTLFQATKGDWE